jgi:O-acetyl-ADP-ribose deacetylase (regulator of RNase III)
MKVSIFIGDIADAPAEAVCTSTNPRLSLMMGTGAAIRERGGFEVLRECEAIIAAEAARSGRQYLPLGSVHITSAGRLRFTLVVHCVASDSTHHRSSAEVVGAVVTKALAAADAAHCLSIAMPVFGTGHARLKFDQALAAMAEALRASNSSLQQVVIAINDREHIEDVRCAFPGVDVMNL